MIENMDTLRRMANAIQWDISSKKRTKPDEDILGGEVVRIDKEFITLVAVDSAVEDLRRGRVVTCVYDNGEVWKDYTPHMNVAYACVPLEPLKQWLSTFNGDAVQIYLKSGTVLLCSEIDGVDVGCLVAERIEREDCQ